MSLGCHINHFKSSLLSYPYSAQTSPWISDSVVYVMLLLLYFSFPFQIDIVWGSFLIPGTVLGSHTVAMETGVVSAPITGQSVYRETARSHGVVACCFLSRRN